jgi:DNA-binding NtrC family response regulator
LPEEALQVGRASGEGARTPAWEEEVDLNEFSVLLVDDEPEFLETLVKRLRKRKLNATGAKSGEEALEVMRSEPVDVVVLDVKMPGMDGIETLRELKKIRPLVEVIMLTGHANMEVAITGMELGAFDYLMKPMDIDELLYKLQDAYKKKSLQEQKIHVVKEELGVKA